MPREKETYRMNLERICEAFPNKEMLTATEIARFWGKDVRTVKKAFPHMKFSGVSKAKLASYMSD